MLSIWWHQVGPMQIRCLVICQPLIDSKPSICFSSTAVRCRVLVGFKGILHCLGNSFLAPKADRNGVRRRFLGNGSRCTNSSRETQCIGGSRRRRLACALLEQETIARALFPENCAEMVAWVGFNCKCFNKMFERVERADVKSTFLVI